MCSTVLAAINEDSCTVPTLLTDYILNGQSNAHAIAEYVSKCKTEW